MKAITDIAGTRFGALVCVSPDRAPNGRPAWLCHCNCGKEIIKETSNLKTAGGIPSCGCLLNSTNNLKHGHARKGNYHPLYAMWQGMQNRCRNPDFKDWEHYGGRGIKVCERWSDFDNFLQDMGERPDGMSIDRIDVNGDYEPGNCRWATAKQQSLNKRNSISLEK